MRLRRSPREIAARMIQELKNLGLLLFPPRLPNTAGVVSPLAGLPNPETVADELAGTGFAEEVRKLSEIISARRIPLFGGWIDAGESIRWRRDYLSGIETDLRYFRRVPYLDRTRAGDHKVVWEMNRHQHLVTIAQAGRLNRTAPAPELWSQLDTWIEANPFQRGINWASALEVAFRALSWIWIYHLSGNDMPVALRTKFLEMLYRHGCHLEVNLSYYFSPNTHLLGEAVVLHALGKLFPTFPRAAAWTKLGAHVVEDQIRKQVRTDGGHFEQSTYYHVYALDMFVFHAVLSPVSSEYLTRLTRMGDYLNALAGPARTLPFLGDDDGGRFFHPFGRRDRFCRASLACAATYLHHSGWNFQSEDFWPIAAWWLGRTRGESAGDPASRLFSDTGIAVMTSGENQVIADAGPFGPWSGGHSHSDTLSIVVKKGDEDVLIDPGTYTYAGEERNEFRSSAAHNTVRVDGGDQAAVSNMFGWSGRPTARIHFWESGGEFDELMAECSYRGFRHRRRVRFVKAGLILVVDDIDGPEGEHEIEGFWHLGSEDGLKRLVLAGPWERQSGWRSTVYGMKEPVPVACVRRRTVLPCRLSTAILLSGGSVEIDEQPEMTKFVWHREDTAPVIITL